MIHSDSPFCEIVSLKNYFTTEIVTMDFLLVQLHFTIRRETFLKSKKTLPLQKVAFRVHLVSDTFYKFGARYIFACAAFINEYFYPQVAK
jgi:hypothetical protein